MDNYSKVLLAVGLLLTSVFGIAFVYFSKDTTSIQGDSDVLFATDSGEEGTNLINSEGENMSEVQDYSAFQFTTKTEGTGEQAQPGDTVVVHYSGTLIDGTKFDSSYDRGTPFEFTLGEGMVITGWEEGVKGMKVGEIRELQIPSSMGYGESGAGGVIPPSAGLLFTVELLQVK